MRQVFRWLSVDPRGLRLRLLAGVGLAVALVVPAQALGRHSTRSTTQATAAKKCNYSFYDPSADAPGFTGQQEDQLDLIKGTFGLNSKHTVLRVVLNIKNLSKTIPAPANYMDYLLYWTNPAGDSGPNAVDVTVDSSGTVTYTDGSVTVVNGNTNYTPSSTLAASVSFGSGPDGAIEVDVPLSALGLKRGQALTGVTATAGSGASTPAGSLASINDSDTGNAYKVGQPTCIDPEHTTVHHKKHTVGHHKNKNKKKHQHH